MFILTEQKHNLIETFDIRLGRNRTTMVIFDHCISYYIDRNEINI